MLQIHCWDRVPLLCSSPFFGLESFFLSRTPVLCLNGYLKNVDLECKGTQ
jgi:hypothetical protein